MTATTYVQQRGETVVILVLDEDADVSQSVRVDLRRVGFSSRLVDPAEPVAASFDVAYRAATTELGKGWNLTLPAATCEALTAGLYQLDLRIEADGIVITSDPAYLDLREPATV